jgi:dTDP-4-dehydrorhamnose 3,5-epimerase
MWMDFRGVAKENMLLNIANIEHNPSEAINIDLSEINYEW